MTRKELLKFAMQKHGAKYKKCGTKMEDEFQDIMKKFDAIIEKDMSSYLAETARKAFENWLFCDGLDNEKIAFWNMFRESVMALPQNENESRGDTVMYKVMCGVGKLEYVGADTIEAEFTGSVHETREDAERELNEAMQYPGVHFAWIEEV